MSYSFRNRPKLSERYRGKSGDEILNELKNQIDEDRKMFFESSPGWNSVQSPGSFSRTSHPLDDMMSRGRQDIRSHLDDLAQRHPEFADHLRCPPWGGEMGATSRGGTWGRKRRGSGSSSDDMASQESSQGPPQSGETTPSRGRSRQNNLPQYGLRNTVDLGQQQQQCEDQEKGRGQRSWSAPPDNRTQNSPNPPRYVSRLDIPINAMPNNVNSDQGKPPVVPKQQQQQQQSPQPNPNSKQSQHGSSVRHIPIFVEGRDEPLLPKVAAGGDVPTEKIYSERVPPHQTFNYGRPSQFTAQQSQHQMPPTSHMPQQASYTQHTVPSKAKTFAQQQVPPQHQVPQTSEPCQSMPQQDQGQSKCSPQLLKQPVANNPISHVQAVQNDVNELKIKVAQYSGKSRKDSDYMYLDEMLTRNLLKLDNIETDGKDNVRQARKAVIQNIQQCISILESKVPSPDEVCQNSGEVIEKSNEVCGVEFSQNSAVKDSSVLQVQVNKTEMSVPQEVLSESGQKVDRENYVNSSQSGLVMDTESIENLNKGNGDEAKPESNNKGAVNEKTSKIKSPQQVAQHKNLENEMSGNITSDDCVSVSQQTDMQLDVTAAEQSHKQMEGSKETVPVPHCKGVDDGRARGDGVNKTAKSKSLKGSPKKGKHET